MPITNPRIYINLPIADLSASIAFYTAIGFTPNPKYSDAGTMMMVLSPTIHVMLLTHARFRDFMPADREVSDPRTVTETMLCIGVGRKGEVDELVERAGRAGGKRDPADIKDATGEIHGRNFEDLDGHVWEVVCMGEEKGE